MLSFPSLYGRWVCAICIGIGGLMHLIGMIESLNSGYDMPMWFYAVFFFAIPAYFISPFLISINNKTGYFIPLLCPLIGGLLILVGFLFPSSRLLILIPGTFSNEITLIGFVTLVSEPIAVVSALVLVINRAWASEGGE